MARWLGTEAWRDFYLSRRTGASGVVSHVFIWGKSRVGCCDVTSGVMDGNLACRGRGHIRMVRNSPPNAMVSNMVCRFIDHLEISRLIITVGLVYWCTISCGGFTTFTTILSLTTSMQLSTWEAWARLFISGVKVESSHSTWTMEPLLSLTKNLV